MSQSQVVDRVPEESLPQHEQDKLNNVRKNHNFIQLYKHNMSAYRNLIKTDPTAAEIFLFLAEYMTTANAVCCSQKVLQEVTQKGRTTVFKAVRKLKEQGFVNVLKTGSSNIYVLNPEVVWSAYKTSKPYCKFEGPILIAKSENEELQKKLKKMKATNLEIDSHTSG